MKALISELKAIFRNFRFFRSFPQNIFSQRGFLTIENALTFEECQEIIREVTKHDLSESKIIVNDCYVMRRGQIQVFDKNVVQVINIDQLSPRLKQIISKLEIENYLRKLTNQDFNVVMSCLQIDYMDTISKRGFHIDGFKEPWFKAFIYLNDVNESGDGPLTIIPSSHLSPLKLAINVIWNNLRILKLKKCTENPKESMNLFFRDENAHKVLGKAGTMTLANVSCVHKGWNQHDKNDRYCLMIQATPTRYASMRKNIFSPEIKLKKYGVDISSY